MSQTQFDASQRVFFWMHSSKCPHGTMLTAAPRRYDESEGSEASFDDEDDESEGEAAAPRE